MLIKHGSPIARQAAFPAPKQESVIGREVEPVQPSEAEIALARVNRENETLRGEIVALKARWAEEMTAAERLGREAAARDHVRDDAKRVEVLAAGLADARRHFEAQFIEVMELFAVDLALMAMDKLFEVRAQDKELLASVVARRLTAIDDQAIVELAVSPDDADGPVEVALAEKLPPGTRVVSDPTLRGGTARLQLRLGSVPIDPVAGFERLRSALTEGAGNA